MQDKVIELIGDSLNELDLKVDSVIYETEGTNNYLRIALDADFIIDLNTVTEASRIINLIIDKANLINETYILDIYAKPKGDDKNE